jgi:hypothetical protein
MMFVRFKNSKDEVVGVAELTKAGKVRFRGPMAKSVRKTVVTEPNTMRKLVPESDGEAYLRALPYTFRPPYFFAEVVNDGG